MSPAILHILLFSIKEYQGNTDSTTVKRNEVYFTTTSLRLYPKRKRLSTAIALRMEIYGCHNSKLFILYFLTYLVLQSTLIRGHHWAVRFFKKFSDDLIITWPSIKNRTYKRHIKDEIWMGLKRISGCAETQMRIESQFDSHN